MLFGEWLNQNLAETKRLPECQRFGHAIVLSDPDAQDSAQIRVVEVPPSVSVVIPQQAGQWNLFNPGPHGWKKRCDYILMDETDDHYFAILVELKTNAPDDKGDTQLKWSLPIFHYLLSVFCIDSHSSKWNKRLKIKYFQIGTNIYELHKDLTRIDGSNFFEKTTDHEIDILYSDSELFSLNQLLKASAR